MYTFSFIVGNIIPKKCKVSTQLLRDISYKIHTFVEPEATPINHQGTPPASSSVKVRTTIAKAALKPTVLYSAQTMEACKSRIRGLGWLRAFQSLTA